MTGLPTVLGWYVHEWLWRDDTADLNEKSIMLPDGSGLRILEELEAQGRRASVIIISARDALEDRIEIGRAHV